MSGDHNKYQKDSCNHSWQYIGSKRQQAWECYKCQSWTFEKPREHWSDCSVHNEPAYPAGECDCGGFKESKSSEILVSKKKFDEWLKSPFTKALRTSHKQTVKDIINTLMINHEAAKDRHNYFLVAANLIEAEFGENNATTEKES